MLRRAAASPALRCAAARRAASSWIDEPVSLCESVLANVHAATGMPWWATIVTVAFAMRAAVTLPLAVYVQRASARGQLAAEEQRQIEPELVQQVALESKSKGLSFEAFEAALASARHSAMRAIHRRHRAYMPLQLGRAGPQIPFPVPFLLPWAQVPLFVSMSMALRRMTAFPLLFLATAGAPVAGMTSEGALWFTDLAAPDPLHLAFGVAIGFTSLVNIEFVELSATRQRSRFGRTLTNALRGLALLAVPVAGMVPSAVSLYWLASSLYGLGQSVVLRQARVRRALGIPRTAQESEEMLVWKRIRQARARGSQPH